MKASLISRVWYPAPNALMSAEVQCIRNLCSVITSEKIKKGFSVLLKSQFCHIPFNVLNTETGMVMELVALKAVATV